MKQVLIVGALLLPAMVMTVGMGSGHLVAQPSAPRSKWEYKVLSPPAIETLGGMEVEALAAGLNILGDAGWELVAIEPGHLPAPVKLPRYVFKRPR